MMFRQYFAALSALIVIFFAASIGQAAENPDVIKLKKDLIIAKDMVVKDVIVVDGDLTVLGRIEGNVVVVGGAIMLRPDSYVGGSISVVGKISKDPAARVIGKITQVYMPRFIPYAIDFFRGKGGWIAFWTAISVMALLGFLGLSILIVALIPEHMGAIVARIEISFIATFLWGLLWTALVIPVAILLAISIVGVVLIPLEILLVALALLVGYIAAAIFIGNKIFFSMKKPVIPFLNAVLGVFILFLAGFVPVAGAIINSIFLITGYGAVVISMFGTKKEGTNI